jgi:tetratricopeptide (TPR) repeat protein
MEADPAVERREQVDRLLREAHLLRVRRQWAEAEMRCREALQVDPQDITATEMLAEFLYDKGSYDEALTLLRAAAEREPDRAPLEEMIGRCVLAKQQDEHERAEALATLEGGVARTMRRGNALVGVLLSLICPGGGQMFYGQYLKGGILMASGILAFIIGWNDMAKFFLGLAGMLPAGREIAGLQAGIGMAGIAVYIYSLLDAAAAADRGRKRRL